LNFAFLPFVKASSQQYLPFTVLKLNVDCLYSCFLSWSQQYLPFTVLKRYCIRGDNFASELLQ